MKNLDEGRYPGAQISKKSEDTRLTYTHPATCRMHQLLNDSWLSNVQNVAYMYLL